ncbi:hypothetical protein SKAU_G00269210 [Synaphobranchus kaupii]|uniref:DUF4806 domain-containing protein n=1 Tax=Synaphobranchus kaupii TaxID=118154 RepID=A0A9Q1IQ61_SYNKA|nr:hypothetical protein SKAU_G00269210 [Synaphobranchus kaupii]
MFFVIKFLESETVAVVPSEWYHDGETFWPNYSTDQRLDKAVQQREPPGWDWAEVDCIVLKTCDNYLAARRALKKSLTCSTSGMQSGSEKETSRPKRKQKPIHHFGDSDQEDDGDVPLPRRHHAVRQIVQFPPGSSPMAFSAAPPPPIISPVGSNESLGNAHLFSPTYRVARAGLGPIPCTAAQLHILTLLENIEQQQTQIMGALTTLAARMDDLEGGSVFGDIPEDFQFPINNLEEVKEFETWLGDHNNLAARKKMIQVLASLGGQDTRKVTWNMLSYIFANGVAKKINWKGANNKLKFSNSKMSVLIICAVQKSFVGKRATQDQINKHCIRWFGLASDRAGGRKERYRSSLQGREAAMEA